MVRLTQVRSASNGTAWKTARMRGYFYKDVPSGAADGTFNIVFVQADGDAFTFAVDASNGVTGPTPSGSDSVMEVTGELLSLMMSSDWQMTTREDAEAVRNPASGTEW